MELNFDYLNTNELNGATQADYLVAFDAHLCLLDGEVTVCDEPGFPVVELARSLLVWLGDPLRGDFEFDSISYEEQGVIWIRESAMGWLVGSVFAPGVQTAPADWLEVIRCCWRFIERVEADLEALGLEPAEVLKR